MRRSANIFVFSDIKNAIPNKNNCQKEMLYLVNYFLPKMLIHHLLPMIARAFDSSIVENVHKVPTNKLEQ